MSQRGRKSERGSATVLAVSFVVLLVTVGLGGASVAGIFVAHRRVDAGADLAALAGAAAVQQGRPGCEAASALAAANRVRLVGCTASAGDVSVRVTVEAASVFGWSATISAYARAGPVRPP